MGSPAERKAETKGIFRRANERLNEGARKLLAGDSSALVPFLCECPRADCMQVVLLTTAEYEAVRARREQALATPGHQDPEIERVLEENERFIVTEKLGSPGDLPRGTAERS